MSMTITEQSRLNLYESMREHHGEEVAVTLMEMLPPVGWADIATKSDLEHLRSEITLSFRAELEHALRRQGQWMVATIFAAQVVLVGAMKLL